jgi:hypothetical protein
MALEEIEKIIGGPPGWYDGVVGHGTDAPARKGAWPSWIGSGGEIMVDMQMDKAISASFYPNLWVNQDWGRFARERLTRNVFRNVNLNIHPAYADIVYGSCTACLFAVPLAFLARFWRSIDLRLASTVVLITGACVSLFLIVLGVTAIPYVEAATASELVGAGGTGFVVFTVGTLGSFKRIVRT